MANSYISVDTSKLPLSLELKDGNRVFKLEFIYNLYNDSMYVNLYDSLDNVIWEREKIKLEKEREKIIAEAKVLAEKIGKASLTINMKVGENGKLFGSVTSADIAEAFKNSGLEINKHDILLPEPIKEIGAFTVNVRVHPEVMGEAKVWVVEEKAEESK